MAYRLRTSDKHLGKGFRRVALKQLDQALAALETGSGDVHEDVHDARKRCKKLRGLIRLFRGAFPHYSEENRALRDAARLISDLRDKTAMIECYDRVMERYGGTLNRQAFAPLRAAFTRERNAAGEAGDLRERMAAMAEALRAVRARAEGWRLDDRGWSALEEGVATSYRRARKAMAEAEKTRDAEHLHEWRKRVKYHWYHLRLLSGAETGPIEGREIAADRLSDLLGDHHDLTELAPRLAHAPLGEEAGLVLAGLIDQERARIEEEAFAMGHGLFAAKPKALIKDLRGAVTTWYAAA
ncbi:CHAD domain-containing protein [Roseivivax sp. CAU 1761]